AAATSPRCSTRPSWMCGQAPESPRSSARSTSCGCRAIPLRGRDELVGLDGVARLYPGLESSGERPNRPISPIDQHAGHPGRRSLVGSRAVEDDLLVSRKRPELRVEIVDVENGCALDAPGIANASGPGADVEHDRVLSVVHQAAQLLDGDSSHSEELVEPA